MSVADNLARIRENIGQRPVRLVAVTKNARIDQLQAVLAEGVFDFAENRVQDAFERRSLLPSNMADKVHWHFIGHLQSNKVKKVVGEFDLIHSIDSLKLAEEVSRVAVEKGLVQPVLLQVKVVEDEHKTGFSIAELKSCFAHLLALPGIKIEGLMTITPLTADNTIWQFCFKGLKLLRDELKSEYGVNLKELSMGMTQDYEEAIACGSTMVRLGRAIFGR